ncbi:SGNH/GDSL hydrolase family protein [Pseudonocardiaceae bacterium YIM PH 21723]|nr:SGNH/GDSL hydrolase family protein [Pseudonocardiaceae bacterium YIM PH 21723]
MRPVTWWLPVTGTTSLGGLVRTRTLLSLLFAGLLTVAVTAPATASPLGWTAGWAASPQAPTQPLQGQNWSLGGFTDQTLRQVVRSTSTGPAIRIRLTHTWGTQPLRVTAASVADTAGPGAIRSGSSRTVTFNGSRNTIVAPGGLLTSDPVPLPVTAGQHLTVSLYFAPPTGPVATHWNAQATSYLAKGDHRGDTGAEAFTEKSEAWYVLAGVDTVGPRHRGAVATLGDSITDGYGSTVDADHRYPDYLADRLHRPVINAGISGNRLLADSPCCGERATARYQRDVLDQPGVCTVIVLEGINDIGFPEINDPSLPPSPKVTAAQLIAAHRELIARAHARGLRIIGATVLPYKGAAYFSEEGNATRKQVNDWVRGSGAYDGIADLDRAVADPADPERIRPDLQAGDWLHPNDAGYLVMAQAVNPDLLG